MFSTIKQVLRTQSTFAQWNGKNDSFYQTSNKLIAKYFAQGIDSQLNSATVKQIAVYDRELLETMLADGLQIAYQTHTIELRRVSKISIQAVVTNMKTALTSQFTLSQATLKMLAVDRTINHDVLDVIQGLYEKVNG